MKWILSLIVCILVHGAAAEGEFFYVNPDGGLYLHCVRECRSMSEKYYEKMLEVPYTRRETADYCFLSACPVCHKKPFPADLSWTEDEAALKRAFEKEVKALESASGVLYRQFDPQEIVKISELEARSGLHLLEEVYVAPGPEDLPAAEIAARAAAAVQEAFGWQDRELTVYQCSLLHYKESDTLYWYVSFTEGGYCLLTQAGEVTENPVHGRFTPAEQAARGEAKLTMLQVIEQYTREHHYLWPKTAREQLSQFKAPPAGAISEEMAKRLALKMAKVEDKENYRVYALYQAEDIWRVLIKSDLHTVYADVYIHAFTGQLDRMYYGADGNG